MLRHLEFEIMQSTEEAYLHATSYEFVEEEHTRSAVPVGKYGSTSVKDPTNMRGSW